MNKKGNHVLDATILLTTYGVVPSTYSLLFGERQLQRYRYYLHTRQILKFPEVKTVAFKSHWAQTTQEDDIPRTDISSCLLPSLSLLMREHFRDNVTLLSPDLFSGAPNTYHALFYLECQQRLKILDRGIDISFIRSDTL